VIHHGAPSEAGTRSPNGEGAYVLCVSSFEPNKNLGTLIGAFRNAALSWEGRLVLAGRSGSELQVLRDRVDKHNLHNRVKLIVDPDDRELSRLYKGATIFVFPSLYEGFGLPILEAMAWGLPVLTGTAAACREVAGEAGIAVPTDTAEAWASSLSKVLSDPRTLEELGAKSLARAGAFSWQKAAKSTWDTLVSSLGER
jgi:glycosyltransferase involved in cell wall biosynthesis